MYMLDAMSDGRSTTRAWRVAVASPHPDLESRGFMPVVIPILVEGPPSNGAALLDAARHIDRYHWAIFSSVRGVRAILAARGSGVPPTIRTAAVGPVTASELVKAGARDPLVGETFNADALWATLRDRDAWPDRRVLIVTVAGGRRDVAEGLRSAGATVDEIEAYVMQPRPAAAIALEWTTGRVDAVILGSAAAAQHLIDAVGRHALQALRAVVPIGPMTARALVDAGLDVTVPRQATFAAAIEHLAAIRSKVEPSGAG